MNIIAFLLLAVIGLATKGVSPLPQTADEDADIYLIYSLMMTNPPTSHGDNVYLISENDSPRPPC